MTAKPTPPTVPDPALRSNPDTFNDRVEDCVTFWATLVDYMSKSNDYTEEQATAALAAAIGGDLPALAGNALRALRLNSGGTAAEFATIADLLNDGGVTLPAGALVGTTATQTLTNKTMTSPKVNLGSDADGDVYYRSGGNLVRLGKGTAGQVLRMNSGATAPEWSAFNIPAPDFTSSEQTINNGSGLNIAHGLGAKPSRVDAVLVCKNADVGWSVGDEIELPSKDAVSSSVFNFILGWNATNITVVTCASGVQSVNKSTGSASTLNNSSWRIVAKAWV